MGSLRWELSVLKSRWRNRLHYALAARRIYRNWWVWPLPKIGISTVIELRCGLKFLVRAGTTDLAVVNEAALSDPYLGPGHITLPDSAIVIDLGANIGDFSIVAAARCPNGRVFAIEPIAANARMIEINRILNGLTNIEIVEAAVGAHEGCLTMYSAGNRSGFHFSVGDSHEKVPVITLRQVIEQHRLAKVDLLKLDCEGAEWEILPSSLALLPQIDQICMEFHPRDGWTPERLAGLLRSSGFDVHHTSGGWNGLLWATRPRSQAKSDRAAEN